MNPIKSRLTTLMRSWSIREEGRVASRTTIAFAAVLASLVSLSAAAATGENTNKHEFITKSPPQDTFSEDEQPASKEDCKDGGWKNFTNPTFKNQGECVSHFANLKTRTAATASQSTTSALTSKERRLVVVHREGSSVSILRVKN